MRALARGYLQHGRRHSPEGSDPIPGLATGANLPWASVENIGFSLASSTSTSNVDFNTATSSTGGSSGDSQLTLGTIATGVFGININEAGVYLITFAGGGVVTSAPAAGSACIARASSLPDSNGWHQYMFTGSPTFWQQVGGTQYNANQSDVWLANLDSSFVTSFPVGVGGTMAQNSGVSMTASATLTIVQLSAVTDSGYEF